MGFEVRRRLIAHWTTWQQYFPVVNFRAGKRQDESGKYEDREGLEGRMGGYGFYGLFGLFMG